MEIAATSWSQTVVNALTLPVPPVLVSIMSGKGSTPRTAGARMLLDGNGVLHGTIGGGRYEAEALQCARDMQESWKKTGAKNFLEDNARVLYFSLRGVSDMDMVCGGELRLLLELLVDTPEAQRVFSLAAQAEATARGYLWVTRISMGEGSELHAHGRLATAKRCILGPGIPLGSEEAALPHEVVKVVGLQGGAPREILCADALYLAEPCAAKHRVHIVGGGHVSLALASLLHTLDFYVFVLEDRAEFLTRERFPFAERRLLFDLSRESIAGYLGKAGVDESHGIVIMTRGHAYDREALAASLNSNAGYMGMIGSKAKWNTVFEALCAEGAPCASLERVHSPIGLSIGAQTPEEIAVSIAAELIIWRSKHGKP